MPPRLLLTLLFTLALLMAGCVTAVDSDLPYATLPHTELAVDVPLTASAADPLSSLPVEPALAGAEVAIIGKDTDGAYLLVLDGELLGWMPTIFAAAGQSTVEPALTIDPLPPACGAFLDAQFDLNETWHNRAQGDRLVYGSIYRSDAAADFADSTLTVNVTGGGGVSGDYIHVQLTPKTALVLFAFTLEDLRKNSEVAFTLANAGRSPARFQASYFENKCPERFTGSAPFRNSLPVGQLRVVLRSPEGVVRPPMAEQEADVEHAPPPAAGPTMEPTPVVITHGPSRGEPKLADLEAVIHAWDEIHHESDYTLDNSLLGDVLTEEALQQQQQALADLRRYNCYWEFRDLDAPETIAWQVVSNSEVTVDSRKHWDAKRYCNNALDAAASFNDPFLVRYRMVLTDRWRIAEKRVIEDSASLMPTAQPPQADSGLRDKLVRKSQTSGVALAYRTQADDFIRALVGHLDDFSLPTLGVTSASMTAALERNDAGDRINSLVQEVWDDWANSAASRGWDAYVTDPGGKGFSPFRTLTIRLIQGRQGRLADSEQHALHNYFSRAEDSSVWARDPDAVIGAVNRESFRWP